MNAGEVDKRPEAVGLHRKKSGVVVGAVRRSWRKSGPPLRVGPRGPGRIERVHASFVGVARGYARARGLWKSGVLTECAVHAEDELVAGVVVVHRDEAALGHGDLEYGGGGHAGRPVGVTDRAFGAGRVHRRRAPCC
jgi:hypothetical protein